MMTSECHNCVCICTLCVRSLHCVCDYVSCVRVVCPHAYRGLTCWMV